MLNNLAIKVPKFINITFKHESTAKIPLQMLLSFGKNKEHFINCISICNSVCPVLKDDGFLQFVQNTNLFTNKNATFSNLYYSLIYNKLIG